MFMLFFVMLIVAFFLSLILHNSSYILFVIGVIILLYLDEISKKLDKN